MYISPSKAPPLKDSKEESPYPAKRQGAKKRYEAKLIQKNLRFNPYKPLDNTLLTYIKADGRPFAQIVRSALCKEFEVVADTSGDSDDIDD